MMKKCLLAVALLFGSTSIVPDSVIQVVAAQRLTLPSMTRRGADGREINSAANLANFYLNLRGMIEERLDIDPNFEVNANNFGEFVGGLNLSQNSFENLEIGMSAKYCRNYTSKFTESFCNMLGYINQAKLDPLYSQISKFVGRVEIEKENGHTGTGTLVYWDGMPEDMIGKVVITCGHNNPVFVGTGYNPLASLGATQAKEGMFVSTNPGMAFTPDFAQEQVNGWGRGRLPGVSFGVEKCYFFKDYLFEKNNNANAIDFAVLILEQPIMESAGHPMRGANLNHIIYHPEQVPDLIHAGMNCFSVGYGTPYFIKNKQYHDTQDEYIQSDGILGTASPLAGWNIKKATDCYGTFRLINDDRLGTYDTYNETCGQGNILATGPSDSGSPIILRIGQNYMIVGVTTGTINLSLVVQRDRIRHAVWHAVNRPLPGRVERYHVAPAAAASAAGGSTLAVASASTGSSAMPPPQHVVTPAGGAASVVATNAPTTVSRIIQLPPVPKRQSASHAAASASSGSSSSVMPPPQHVVAPAGAPIPPYQSASPAATTSTTLPPPFIINNDSSSSAMPLQQAPATSATLPPPFIIGGHSTGN